MNTPYDQLITYPLPGYHKEGVMISQADLYVFVCPAINQVVVVETKVLRDYIETHNPTCKDFGKSIGALVPLADIKVYKALYFDAYCTNLIDTVQAGCKDTTGFARSRANRDIDKSKVAESIFNHFCPHAIANHNQPQDNWDFVVTGKVSGKEYKVEVKWDSKGGNPNLYCELYTQPKTWQERQALFG